MQGRFNRNALTAKGGTYRKIYQRRWLGILDPHCWQKMPLSCCFPAQVPLMSTTYCHKS